MSRKDFELIAQVLKRNKASKELVEDMAVALGSTNPRFHKLRFMDAAGIVFYPEEREIERDVLAEEIRIKKGA